MKFKLNWETYGECTTTITVTASNTPLHATTTTPASFTTMSLDLLIDLARNANNVRT